MSTGASGYVRREAIIPPPDPKRDKNRGSFSAFRYPAFRYYFFGQLVSISGTWMQSAAQQVVVYQLTKSEASLGITAFMQGIPGLLLTPLAGVLLERVSRRKLLLAVQVFMMILAFTLAGLVFTNTLQVWHIYVLSFMVGIANSVDAPARQSFVIEMVGHEDLPSGIAMNSIMFNSARIIGPFVGGVTLQAFGVAWCFLFNGLSFIAVIISLVLMHIKPTTARANTVSFINQFREGILYARTHPIIGPLLLNSLIVSCFGIAFATQFASYAFHVLNDPQGGTTALLTAQGIGTLCASVLVASTANRGIRGKLLVLSMIVGPFGLLGMAFIKSYTLALIFCGITGGMLILQFILTNTLIQNEVPDELRGRVMSLWTLTFFGIAPFSNLLLGVVAQALGVTSALLCWGVLCGIGSSLIVWRLPKLRLLA